MTCDKCGSRVMVRQDTGSSCPICGRFIFAETCTEAEEWNQYRVDSQLVGVIDGWPARGYPVAQSWVLIEHLSPIFPQRFKEYACV